MTRENLVVSSSNKGKIEEIKSILKGLPFNIISKDQAGLDDLEVIEDKDTLEGNAIKKALAIHKHTKGIVIADDSGLFVEHLKGKPGIYSARYAGADADDKANNKKLLKQLINISIEKRGAKFKTVIAIVWEDGSVETVIGVCKGTITMREKGEFGFGYDPLFIPEGYKKTFAELDQDIKNNISHRRDALEKLKDKLKKTRQGMSK